MFYVNNRYTIHKVIASNTDYTIIYSQSHSKLHIYDKVVKERFPNIWFGFQIKSPIKITINRGEKANAHHGTCHSIITWLYLTHFQFNFASLPEQGQQFTFKSLWVHPDPCKSHNRALVATQCFPLNLVRNHAGINKCFPTEMLWLHSSSNSLGWVQMRRFIMVNFSNPNEGDDILVIVSYRGRLK